MKSLLTRNQCTYDCNVLLLQCVVLIGPDSESMCIKSLQSTLPVLETRYHGHHPILLVLAGIPAQHPLPTLDFSTKR